MKAWYEATTRFGFRDLHTQVRDEGEGEVLLCLHGFPTSSWDFEPVWPALSARFRCIAPDLIGLGRASKPDHALSVGLQADMVQALLQTQDITRVRILAHDLGDTVAQELLARHAEGRLQIDACALLNGGLFPETHQPRLIQRLLISPLGSWVARLSSERTFRSNMTAIFGPDTPPSEDFLAHSWALLLENDGRRCLPHLIRYMRERQLQRERWVAPLQSGQVPLWLVNGTLDPVSGGHMVDRFEELGCVGEVHRLEHLGHYPHVEDPDATLRALEGFLTSA